MEREDHRGGRARVERRVLPQVAQRALAVERARDAQLGGLQLEEPHQIGGRRADRRVRVEAVRELVGGGLPGEALADALHHQRVQLDGEARDALEQLLAGVEAAVEAIPLEERDDVALDLALEDPARLVDGDRALGHGQLDEGDHRALMSLATEIASEIFIALAREQRVIDEVGAERAAQALVLGEDDDAARERQPRALVGRVDLEHPGSAALLEAEECSHEANGVTVGHAGPGAVYTTQFRKSTP